MGFWWRPLGELMALAFAAALFGLAAGVHAGLGLLGLGLLILLVRQFWFQARLARWLEEGTLAESLGAAPRALGVWGDIYYRLNKLLSRQSRSNTELANALGQFQQAAEAVPDGLVILDENDRIQWCNPASNRYLGLDCRRDHGQYISYLMRQAPFLDFLRERDYSRRLVCRSPLSRETALSMQLVPYGAQKLLMVRDITDLERVDAMRRDFIANVSHEMRTPLTVVGGFVETLADAQDMKAEDMRPYLQLMQSHTQRMQRLIEDLLMLSRLESTDHERVEERVPVPALVHELEGEAGQLSRGRHRISARIESGAWLSGSSQEIHSAFSNLVSNAVRYTPAGGSITLTWKEEGGEGVFAVTDSGEGIAPEHLPRLTERFYRVDRSRSRETGGTGLGLAIVKHVLTRHGARLDIQSIVGRGSTFAAIFPAERLLTATQEDNVIPFPAERSDAA